MPCREPAKSDGRQGQMVRENQGNWCYDDDIQNILSISLEKEKMELSQIAINNFYEWYKKNPFIYQ